MTESEDRAGSSGSALQSSERTVMALSCAPIGHHAERMATVSTALRLLSDRDGD